MSRVVPQLALRAPRSRTFQGETFGDRLRRLRLAAGLSQRELGEHANEAGGRVSYAYISRLEHGERQASVSAIRALAPALGVTSTYLEFGVDPEELDQESVDVVLTELDARLDLLADELGGLMRTVEETRGMMRGLRERINLDEGGNG